MAEIDLNKMEAEGFKDHDGTSSFINGLGVQLHAGLAEWLARAHDGMHCVLLEHSCRSA